MTTSERIITKIKKLFALANNKGATVNEAQTAMKMANKLLEKHSITAMDLEVKDDISINFNAGKSAPWERTVFNHVAMLYGCKYFFDMNMQYIAGSNVDRITAQGIGECVINSIKNEGKGKGVQFKNGAAYEVGQTAIRMMDERRENNETAPGTGIALVDIYKQKIQNSSDFLDGIVNLTSNKRKSSGMSQEGRDFGKKLGLNRNLSGNSQKRISN